MSYQFSLEQLLQLRDREKDQKVKSYNEAVDQFEQKAGTLYEMLRSKEHAEEINREKIELTQRNETRKNTYAAAVRNSTGLWSFNLVNGRM